MIEEKSHGIHGLYAKDVCQQDLSVSQPWSIIDIGQPWMYVSLLSFMSREMIVSYVIGYDSYPIIPNHTKGREIS